MSLRILQRLSQPGCLVQGLKGIMLLRPCIARDTWDILVLLGVFRAAPGDAQMIMWHEKLKSGWGHIRHVPSLLYNFLTS